MAIQTLACTQSAVVDQLYPDANYHGAASYRVWGQIGESLRHTRYTYVSFEPIADALVRNRLSAVRLAAYFTRNLDASGLPNTTVTCRLPTWAENSVTYNSRPLQASVKYAYKQNTPPAGNGQYDFSISLSPIPLRIAAVNRSFQISVSGNLFDSGEYVDIYTRAAAESLRPVLSVYFDDEIVPSQIAAANAPTSGYLNPRTATTFAWGYSITDPDYCVANTVTQASATFYWREGSSGSYTAVPISGDALSVTIPANTFPTGSSIQWYVEGTDTFGSTSQTPVYTVSTAAAMVYSTPIAPVQTVEDGSAPIKFTWTTQSDDGYPATGYSLLYKKPSDASWTQLARSETEAGGSYTAPADTFLAGEWLWGVNIQNIDGVWSSGNPSARFVVVAAPPAPIVTASAVPFAAVNWQVEGQQAYRITVDGTVSGPYFGAAKSWTVPDYLRDGEHTIQVEVQGVYGLWSQPGNATFTVRNQAGTPITLEGEFDRDAALSWVAGDVTADFLIYRDDVQIGHTSGLSFTDRLALGPHSYRVINRLPDGNYSISNTVTGTMLSCTAAIAPLTGGDWIELKLSENSDREETFTWSQGVSLRHFAGATYPVAELSPYADESGAYDAAVTDLPAARAFEALRGQPVILKSRGGNVMIGILATLSKRMTEFYIAYVFTLQRMHWRDWIDADG